MVLRKRTSAAGFGNVCRDDAEEDNLFYIHIDIYIYIYIFIIYKTKYTYGDCPCMCIGGIDLALQAAPSLKKP